MFNHLHVLKLWGLLVTKINKYTFWSNEKPYTRNCLINNDKFTVLLLCWNPNVKSAIHDHPCDACFIKVIRGCIKETKYNNENKLYDYFL